MRKILLLLILLSAGVCGHAQIITIAIEATVREVDDDADLLEGAIAIDDIITGTYTYNTDTPDSNGSLDFGHYQHYESPYGIELFSNGLEFKTDPTAVEFYVSIGNDRIGDGYDNYLIRSYNNLSLPNGFGIDIISWQLDDPTGTALSSISLPASAPILDDWQSIFGLKIGSEKIGDNNDVFVIRADVTSAEIIPEPASVLLVGLGICLLRRKTGIIKYC